MSSLDIIHLIGQIIFGVYFIVSGFNHLTNISGLAGYAASKKVPFPRLAVAFTGFLLLFGGLGILFAFEVRIAEILLLLFLIPTTFMMHSFWADKDPTAKMGSRINFQKNLALIGAILILLV